MGRVTEKGTAVTSVEIGDRVLVSCITSSGRCRFCKESRYGLCTGGGGWIFGHTIDGLQAEFARVPFADTSVYKVPENLTDEQVLFLADILPTAFEVGVLNGGVQPGDTVAIVGAGPVGLAAIMTARLFTPGRIVAIDLVDARLEKALEFGADSTINNGTEDAGGGRHGTDGRPRRGRCDRGGWRSGHVRALYGARASGRTRCERRRPRPLCRAAPGEALGAGRHITTGLVDAFTTAQLLKLVTDGKLDATPFVTHRFPLDEAMSAYDTFADAANTHALKVVLEAAPVVTVQAREVATVAVG